MISKNDLINRMKEIEAAKEQTNPSTNTSNLSQSTLDSMAENKRKVDAGLLPQYIGGVPSPDSGEGSSNPEIEKQAKRFHEFCHILGQRKSRRVRDSGVP